MTETSTPKASSWAGEPYALKATASVDVELSKETADLLFEYTQGKKREATELVRDHTVASVDVEKLGKFLKAGIDDRNQLDHLRSLRKTGDYSAEDVAQLLHVDAEVIRSQFARLDGEGTLED